MLRCLHSPERQVAMALILASASPRRAELLRQLDLQFEIRSADIDESLLPYEAPADYVRRLALAKAVAVYSGLASTTQTRVIGSDTAVVVGQKILGKPSHRSDAAAMLAALSGRDHQVFSAVAVVCEQGQHRTVQISTVSFAKLAPTEIEAYLNTDEPWDKAGSYAIQGRAAAFITRLDGSFSGVMGLPLRETVLLLRESGLPIGGRLAD